MKHDLYFLHVKVLNKDHQNTKNFFIYCELGSDATLRQKLYVNEE